MLKMPYGPIKSYWKSPSSNPRIRTGEIHIWRILLDPSREKTSSNRRVLSQSENRRADRYIRDIDRFRFISGRSAIRTILGQYLNIKASKIKMLTNPQGKPFLKESSNLRFNLSHSENYAVLAVTKIYPIGIDLEFTHAIKEMNTLVMQYFSTNEIEQYRSLPEDLQIKGFFNGWTAKEAFVKALGKGFSLPLNQFSLSLIPDKPVVLITSNLDSISQRQWTFFRLEPINGSICTVAVQSKDIKSIKIWDFQR